MIGSAHLLAGLLLLSTQQTTVPPPAPPEPVHEPDAPGSALDSGGVTPPASSTGDPVLSGSPAAPTGPTPQEPPPGSPPPAPEPTTPRITFTLPFPPEQGGGEATGSAGALDYQREDYAVLTGGVKLRYQDIDFAAEVLSIDLSTKELTAVGNVVIDQGPSRLTGASGTYDLDTRLGSFKQASGAAQPGIYFSGERIDKVGEDEYVIEDGIFTSCQGEVPAWSFRVGHARIRLEDYAHIKNASMRAKVVPVLYLPYMIWPTKTDRASGLLVPKIGNSGTRGGYLGLAYYQVLGRSWDTTFFADLFTKDYFGLGNELRYHPSEGTAGAVRSYVIDDPLRNDYRWKVRWDHVTRDLPLGLRGVVQYEDFSDFDYFRDFERGLITKTRNQIYSNAFVTGNWGSQSLNMLVDSRRTFLSADDIIELQQLPEVEYKLRPTRIGRTPIYAAFDTAAHYLSVDRGVVQSSYARFHFQPSLRVPLSPAPWLSVTVNGGGNLTWYGNSVDPTSGNRNTFTGENLDRMLPFGGAEAIGPSFSRIVDRRIGPFGKLKHIIEPRFAWSYYGKFDDQERVPIFDEVDPLQARGLNIGRVALINRVLAKPADATKGEGAREILSFELSRNYSFDAGQPLESGLGRQSALGPLRASLRAYPTARFGLRLDTDYSMLFKELTGIQASGNFAVGYQRFDFTWTPRWQAITGEVLTNQATFGVSLSPLRSRHLNLSSYLTYDFEKSLLRDQRHLLTWLGSCYALHLELHESSITNVRRRDYLFSIDLKNVGTFIDLNGGETEGL